MINDREERLAVAIDEVHIDELRHPDPCGNCLIQLLQAVERHVREETAAIDAYARIGRETPDPVVSAVMQLLVEDEQHHHQLLERIVSSLRDQLNWAPAALALEDATSPDAGSATAVRALAEDERRGARALRRLADAQHAAPGSRLVRLLLQLMATESDKHAQLLDFAVARLSQRS